MFLTRKRLVNPMLWLLLATSLTACHRTPDESRVRQGIEKAEQAAEHANASALDDVLSDDFNGNNGEMERRQLLGLLRAAAFRGETIHALTGPIEVEPHGDRYVARFTVTLTSGGKLLPAQIGVYRVETAWRKEGGEWRCYSATWTGQA
ncbi:hypothetical protein SAMN04487785_102285 [Dyella jiangningensis]|uniref:nuclear transport factor 2 family protein n=1 Tax=Dyella sp. AtDHG13 TaxID=1938897 RepID=UPI00087E1174|nr:nuclear transport factor 2 family protein [Dyella sp. AtDHG13]PXV60562.1 hypothetical protein BDW41_102285 [Dyella sp. AtDHG13]SDJ50345.1 hypothetical protein SAMN04487785_102285 [Dyella jiangningensis]